MAACRLRLLGLPLIEHDTRIIRIPLRKAVALAVYLTVEQRSFSVDQRKIPTSRA